MRSIDDDLAGLSDSRPAAQAFVVLTADPTAMQSEAAVKAMWAGVEGVGTRYAPIRAPIKWVPSDYKLDVELDFADLPHAEVSVESLAPLLRKLSPAAQSQANSAKLAVILRISAATLPNDQQLLLGGLAALQVADQSDGVIVDVASQRAWSRDDWRAALLNYKRKDHVRVARQASAGQARFSSLGAGKFGAPELQLMVSQKNKYPAAMQRFGAVLDALLEKGGRVGDTLAGQVLGACTQPHPTGATCVQVPPPQ